MSGSTHEEHERRIPLYVIMMVMVAALGFTASALIAIQQYGYMAAEIGKFVSWLVRVVHRVA